MAATQTQIRRDSNTNLMAAAPADGELGYDQTNKRIIVGDGSKAGGAPLSSWVDIQGQKFTAITGGGTADAQTLTFPTQLIPAAYATHQRFAFVAGATNTTTCTLNVNALGAKTIKKVEAGAKANLVAGDITSGRPYDVYYDGTDFVLMNAGAGVAPGTVTNASLADAAAGDYIVQDMTDAEDKTTGFAYKKHLEIIVPRDGTYRTRMALRFTGGTAKARIYVGGSAAGAELTGIGGTTLYQNDDITVNAGDLIQLYAERVSGAGSFEVIQLAVMEAAPLNAAKLYTTGDDWQ